MSAVEKPNEKFYSFIVNPHSRSGKGLAIWHQICTVLDERRISYEAFLTEYPGHATAIAAGLTSARHRSSAPLTIIALGGDGTLNEVLNGLSLSADVTLGYIPSGSGNDFSRSLKLPKDPLKALDRILTSEKIRKLDYGILSYMTDHPSNRRFIVSSGIGYDADVCHNLFVSKIKPAINKLHIGKLAYVLIGIKRIILCKESSGYLLLDEEKRVPLRKIRFISSHIHKFEGGGFPFAPKADPSDGYLDLCIVSGTSRLGLTGALLASLMGGHHGLCKCVRHYSCREAVIHTDFPLRIHTDGETFQPQTDISLRCVEKKLNFLC